MAGSSLEFITCDKLRDEFKRFEDDINKRVLIIDVRDRSIYEKSHLCLDSRHQRHATKMRVMNIDPDRLVGAPTAKNIVEQILTDERDKHVFSKRSDADDVILIENNTDNIDELRNPKSKVIRIINALTRYDNQPEQKIRVPIKILRGGYREWIMMYPHWTTDPTFNPDGDLKPHLPPTTVPLSNHVSPNNVSMGIPSTVNTPSAPPMQPPSIGMTADHKPSIPSTTVTHPIIPPKPETSKPVPTPPKPVPTAPKPNFTKNAPGIAVPVTPKSLFRPTLPRSHSSPNVAQAEGDELENSMRPFADQPYSSQNRTNGVTSVRLPTDNYLSPAIAPATVLKPRFDRNLKPALNNESINAIRSRLNFGRTPECSQGIPSGLKNLGNTCFMNSVVQCLAYAPSLASYFCSDLYYNHINLNSQYGSKGELAIEFGALVEKLNSRRNRHIEPISFRDSITKHIGFAEREQQDSHEFMMMLFDKLHHDLNVNGKERRSNGMIQNGPSNGDNNSMNVSLAQLAYRFSKQNLEQNQSIITDLFEGIFMSTLTCSYCRFQSPSFEVFNCLSLQISSKTRCALRDCLSDFSKQETIKGWECQRCKEKREAEKKIVICKLPKILIIHLKRFYLTLDDRNCKEWRQKLHTTVDFPLGGLSVDCTNILPQSASTYDLYAVVNHIGLGLDGGHYTAFCKLENQMWYKFDDCNVSEMRDSDVCGQAAYILFYVSNR